MGIIPFPATITGSIILAFGLFSYRGGLPFNRILICLAIFLFINFLSCKYFRGQSLLETFRASVSFYNLALFWFFYRWKLNVAGWEKTLWWICLVFGICYVIQYIAFPTVIFGGQIRTGSEEQRMAIYGQGLASLSFLFGINKYMITQNKKYIAIILLGLFALIGCGYRTMLLALVVSTVILLVRLGVNKKQLFSFLFLCVILALFISNSTFFQAQIQNMTNRSEDLEATGFENDIRYINIMYHYTDYFKSPLEMFFGSGCPFETSQYGIYSSDILVQYYHFYYADWGLIGLSWIIGIPAVLIMIYYSLKMFLTKVPRQYLYVGVYFFNIVISSITTHEFYIHMNFVVQAILLCIFAKILSENKIRKSILGAWRI